MLVGTNGTTIVRKIPTIIWGKDGRGRTPLLQIKIVKGLKREKFLSLWCDTYLLLIAKDERRRPEGGWLGANQNSSRELGLYPKPNTSHLSSNSAKTT
jgi:hypothetical protein